MNELTSAFGKDRKLLAEKLAGPLAKLLTTHGMPMTKEEMHKLMLDDKTQIEFPYITVKRQADEVTVETTETTTTTTETTTTTTAGGIINLRKLTINKPNTQVK